MLTSTRLRYTVCILGLLMLFVQACQKTEHIIQVQDSQSKLLPLLLEPGDFNMPVNWHHDITSSGPENQGNPNPAESVFRIFDGQRDDKSLVYCEHTLECYNKSPLLELPPNSNRPEIKLNVLEFGDKSLSFCYQSSANQIISCITATQYSNMISKIIIRVTPDSSNAKLLEELVNTALTVTNNRVADKPPCE